MTSSLNAGKYPLWVYWEGPMPDYIAECLDLIRLWHPGWVRLVTRKTFEDELWTRDRDVPLGRACVVHRSDWVRLYLLRWYGGMYSDLDCIPLRNWQLLREEAWRSAGGFASFRSTDNHVATSFTASRPGGLLITLAYEAATTTLRRTPSPGWLELASIPMTEAVRGREELVRLLSLEEVQAISWREQERYFDECETFTVPAGAWCMMLSNQCLGERARRMTREELLHGQTRLGWFLKESRRLAEAAATEREVGLRPGRRAQAKCNFALRSAPANSLTRTTGGTQKRIILTLNTNGDAWHREARLSVMDYAARCGAVLREVREPPPGVRGGYEAKLHLDRLVPEEFQPCRVLYLDRDVVVRNDCPDLFAIVPEGWWGAVSSHQEGHDFRDSVVPRMAAWSRASGLPAAADDEYCNSGVLVFDLPEHGCVFQMAREAVAAHPHAAPGWQVMDQGVLSSARIAASVPLLALPACFNRCGSECWDRYTGEMRAFIYHFCGTGNNVGKINAARWRLPADERRTGGVVRWRHGRPAGLVNLQSAEGPLLWRLWSRVPRGGAVLEAGSLLGSTAWAAAQVLAHRDVTIWAVDQWGGSPDLPWTPSEWHLRWRAFLDNLRDADLEQQVRVMRLPSVVASVHFEDGSLDLVFLDADHRREFVLADIAAWWPKLKPGGVLCGHDYTRHLPGVIAAVDEAFGHPDELSDGEWKVWAVHKTPERFPLLPAGWLPPLQAGPLNYCYEMPSPRRPARDTLPSAKPKPPPLRHGFAA
jgi:SAM-dependent methyltransferase